MNFKAKEKEPANNSEKDKLLKLWGTRAQSYVFSPTPP